MYKCPLCHECCKSDRILLSHFKFNHSVQKFQALKCQQLNCDRVCTNFYGFLKHIKSEHKQALVTINNENCVLPTQSLFQQTNHEFELWNRLQKCSVQHVFQSSKNKQCIQAEDIASTQYANSVSFASSSIISKLHANPSVSRKLISDIVDSVQNLLTLSEGTDGVYYPRWIIFKTFGELWFKIGTPFNTFFLTILK